MTAEDAIPGWLLSMIYPKDTAAAVHRGREGDLKRYETLNPKARVKIACAKCNNGWMSDLETVVKPVLSPWVTGKRTAPRFAEQQALATWSVKTAATLEETQAKEIPRFVFRGHVKELNKRRTEPPNGCYVWITVDKRWVPAAFILAQQTVEREGSGMVAPARQSTLAYDAIMAFGHARIKVLGLATEIHPRLQDHIGLGDALRVWPPEQSAGVLLP